MTGLSNNTVIGLTKEVTPGTFNAPNTTTDLLVVADLKPNIQGLTSDVNEYTGSIHKPGPKVGGATFEISGRALIRGPGGSSPPASDAFVLGRLLQAIGFTETRVTSAVPASPEAVGAGGSTSTVQLGSTATGTADLYNGHAVQIAGLGTSPKNIAQILDYSAGKVATLGEIAGGALTSGNYQILKQLVYRLAAATPPSLSASCWVGGRRYDGNGLALSAFKINLPTFSRDRTDYPSIEFTLSGNLDGSADDTAPTPTISLAPPPYKDGKLWVAKTQLGGSSLDIDFQAQIAYPPNPNQITGSESAVLTETKRQVNLSLNQVLAADLDLIAMADAQAYHPIIAQYGLASANYVLLGVPNARFNYFSPDNSGPLVADTGSLYIDDVLDSVLLSFPIYS